MTPYTTTFQALQPRHDPRHIEAYVRLQHGVLNHLDRETLENEASIAASCVRAAGDGAAESLAQSFGL